MITVLSWIALSIFIGIIIRALWITILCYYLTPRRIRRFMLRQGVSGPDPKLFVGNLRETSLLTSMATSHDMDKPIKHDIVDRILPHYVLWSKTYGKRFIYWYGSEPRFCLTDTEMIKEFLSSKYAKISGKSWMQQEGTKNFIGQGVLMANGSNWLHQRHIVAPAFMGEKLKGHLGCMVDCTNKMLEALQETLKTSNSNEVEIGEYMNQLSGDIIARTEFDTSYEKGKQIFELITQISSFTSKASRYLWIPGSRFLPNKSKDQVRKLKVEAEKLLMEIIQSRKDGYKIGRTSTYGNGMLGMLLDDVSQKKTEGFSYTLQLVMDECKTFFFAGHETTALLLTWTVMLLATNPTWQEKARAEVFKVCGVEPPTVESLSKFNVLTMIINESLRLYPPAQQLPRMLFEDIKLGDLELPKGLSIWIPVIAIHHDKSIWGDDADEFNPERFATRSFAMTRNFLPFGSGPRNCVGQAYALMEAKVVLAMFLSKFKFTISENYRHAPINVLTIRPKYGLQVYLEKV